MSPGKEAIVFIDDKKVKTDGSEVGFSLMEIEEILNFKEEIDKGKNL